MDEGPFPPAACNRQLVAYWKESIRLLLAGGSGVSRRGLSGREPTRFDGGKLRHSEVL